MNWRRLALGTRVTVKDAAKWQHCYGPWQTGSAMSSICRLRASGAMHSRVYHRRQLKAAYCQRYRWKVTPSSLNPSPETRYVLENGGTYIRLVTMERPTTFSQ